MPPIPPEVQAKIDAARKAVAEAIVAAQDAGLVETSIDPPPILDILITGRATDPRTLKNTTAKKPYAVSPEVFGAWFTGYGKLEGINYAEDVRIINPSAGLKQWYDTRARILEQYIQEIRKAKGPAPTRRRKRPSRRKPRRPKNRRRPTLPRSRRAQEGLRQRQDGQRGTRIGGTSGRSGPRSGIAFPGRDCKSRTANVPPWFRARAIGPHLPDPVNPVVVWSHLRTLRSRPHAVTPSVVSKTTAPLPFLSLACEAARRLGAVGVLILAEGPMEWDVVRVLASNEIAILVASSSQRQLETIRKAGLVAIEVEPTEVAISERISLALIEAVANDILQAGARVVVGLFGLRGRGARFADRDPSGRTPGTAHRPRPESARDVGPFRDLEGGRRRRHRDRPRGPRGEGRRHADRRRRCAQRDDPDSPTGFRPLQRVTFARSGTSATSAFARRSRRSPSSTAPSWWHATARWKPPAA